MPRTSIGRVAILLCLSLLAAPAALAEGVQLLSAPELGPIADIQSAVDAAVEGDTLVLAGGDYPGFTIDGKSLVLVAPPGPVVRVTGPVRIRNIAAGQAVLVCGLQVVIPEVDPAYLELSGRALDARSCEGNLRFQGCTFAGVDWSLGTNPSCAGFNTPAGGDAAYFEDCPRVTLSQCVLSGGDGSGSNTCCCSLGGSGGHGLSASQSRIVLQDCALQGGVGGPNGSGGGDGGSGLWQVGGWLYASASSFIGSNGGYAHDFICPVFGGDGGHGIHTTPASSVALQACTLIKGLAGGSFCGTPGSNGLQFTGGGSLQVVAPPGRTLRATGLAADDGTIDVEVRGQPGDQVWLAWARRPTWVDKASNPNAWLVPYPQHLTQQPQGVIPAGGVLSLSVAAGSSAQPVRLRVLQAMVRSGSGESFLTGDRHVVVLDRASAPDCNANGANDWLEVIEGSATDCQPNLVPDGCEPDCDGDGVPDDCVLGNLTLYVDPAAAPGGNGMTCAPFRTISAAVLAAPPGGTLVLRDGVYASPGDRDVVLGNKALTIRSQNGAGSAVIDLLGAGRAFQVESAVQPLVFLNPRIRLEGLTVVDGSVATGGGGLDASHARLELVDCEFTGCSAPQGGGALRLWNCLVTVSGCSFTGNASLSAVPGEGRGGAVLYEVSPGGISLDYPLFEDSRFVGNAARIGGALASFQPPRTTLNRLEFLQNSAHQDGGALYLSGQQTADPLSNSLFAGNTAGSRGGALYAVSLPGGYVGVNQFGNTLVHNQAGGAGGAVFLAGDLTLAGLSSRLFNTLMWDNSAPTGAQVALGQASSGSGPWLWVGYSDLQGGQAAIAVLAGTIQWDPGNLDVDPQFADPDGPDNDPTTILDNDYRPLSAAPVNDAGWNLSASLGPFDLDLEPRFQEDPAAPNTGNGTAPIVDIGAYEAP